MILVKKCYCFGETFKKVLPFWCIESVTILVKLALKELQNDPVSSTFRKTRCMQSLYISYIYIRGIIKNRRIRHTSPFAFLKKCSCEEAPHWRRENLKKDFTFKNKGV